MGVPARVPSIAPTAEILVLIEQAEKRGFKGVAQRLDVRELAKAVAEFAEKTAKELGRPMVEARQRVEEAVKAIKDIHGSRAQPVIEEEVFKRFRNMVQESTAKEIAKAVARASVELSPAQAVEKIMQLATAVRRVQAEAKEKPPAMRQAVQSPEQQQKPLRPSAEVKSI
jgi:valyl-tRNA synthetase